LIIICADRVLFHVLLIILEYAELNNNYLNFFVEHILGKFGSLMTVTTITFLTLSWYEFYEILYNSIDRYEERNILNMHTVFWIVNIIAYVTEIFWVFLIKFGGK